MGRGVTAPTLTRRRVTAIANPITGRYPLWKIDRILRAAARKATAEFHLEVTQHTHHAFLLAQQAAAASDLLLAVGGDGTVTDVVAGAFDSAVPIAIIPNGSTNMLAKDLGIPSDPMAAANVAFSSGVPREIDTGSVNGHTFLHIAGAGFDAEIMRNTPASWKRLLRWTAYAGPAIARLRANHFHVALDIDGEKSYWRARMVLFAIGGSILNARLQLGDAISRTDGIIDVLVFDPPSISGIATTAYWLISGHPERAQWQHHLKGRKATLSTDRAVPFQADGDVLGSTPLCVSINEMRARILTPPASTIRHR